jgi:hypothetical protein
MFGLVRRRTSTAGADTTPARSRQNAWPPSAPINQAWETAARKEAASSWPPPAPIYRAPETGAGKETKRNREEKKQSENTTSNCLERAEVGGCDSNPGKKLLSVPLTFSEVKIASFSGQNTTQPPHQCWPCLKLLLRKPRCERKMVKESLSRNS